jgi:hypothetical protein
MRWTSAPAARDEHRDQKADRARAEHKVAVARHERGALDGAQRVAAGRHKSSEHVVDGVGQLPQGRGRDGGLFGERAGAGVADSQLTAELAHGLVAAAAAAADPAAGQVSPVTRRPSQRSSTPSPIAETVPIHSCPMRRG